MIDNYHFRNIKLAVEQLYPNNDFKIVNDEHIFKIEDTKTAIMLYSVDGCNFAITFNNTHHVTKGNLWEAVKAFCEYVFMVKVKSIYDTYSALEGY